MPSSYPPEPSRPLAIFTTWPFVLALVLLLVNDGLLKQAYPGFVTGKLSDFAGIAVVSLPLFAAFPRYVRAIYLAIAVAFLWWKSPASGASIAFMNAVQPLGIGRTIDYGDLVALAVLPACARFTSSAPRGIATHATLRRWLLPPILAAAVFGVMATSTYLPRKDFSISARESTNPFPRDAIVKAIGDVAKKYGLKSQGANFPHWEGSFKGRSIFMTYSFTSPSEIAVGIQADPGLVGNGEVRRADKLRAEIRKTLSLRFKDLTYVDLQPHP